jgi:hypothetical protein
MGGECGTYGVEEKYIQVYRSYGGETRRKEASVDGRIILTTLKKYAGRT